MSYRNAAESLRAYRDRIASELDEARRAARKLEPLEKELAETERLLEKMVGKRELPLLERVHIAAPCPASWDEMVGDERVRFCGQCEKNVYNLSAMPRDEAEALLRDREGPTCVRLYRRADGTVLTSDCPVGVKRRRRRRALVAAAFGSGVLAAAGAAEATTTTTMGGIQSPVAAPTTSALQGTPVVGELADPPPSSAPPAPEATEVKGKWLGGTLPPALQGTPVSRPRMGDLAPPRRR